MKIIWKSEVVEYLLLVYKLLLYIVLNDSERMFWFPITISKTQYFFLKYEFQLDRFQSSKLRVYMQWSFRNLRQLYVKCFVYLHYLDRRFLKESETYTTFQFKEHWNTELENSTLNSSYSRSGRYHGNDLNSWPKMITE